VLSACGLRLKGVHARPAASGCGGSHCVARSRPADNGADTRHIQAILGHEKLETTQVYTKVAIASLQRVHEKTHPAEKRRRKKAPEGPEPDVTTAQADSPQRYRAHNVSAQGWVQADSRRP